MKGNKKVIEALNEVLTGELTAINQYFLHAAMCKNWGFYKLYKKMHKESIEEMIHAQKLIERVLFLNGIPNLQKLDKLGIGETVPEMLASDMNVEQIALERLRRAIQLCWDERDHASRELFESILENEEDHVDWIETQQGLITTLGLERYLAEQMGESGN